jgi:hypothetical protein
MVHTLLVKRGPTWEERPTRRPAWGETTPYRPMIFYGGRVVINPNDYPSRPPLNRECHEGNIHQTILAEYDTVWPHGKYLDLYWRVYHSISNRIILKIIRKCLQDAKNEQYDEQYLVQTISSYLPSGLPFDEDDMNKMAKDLLDTRTKKSKEERLKIQLEYHLRDLCSCLIERGIELVLERSELMDEKQLKTNQGNAADEGVETDENSEKWRRRDKKRRISVEDKGWKNRMASAKLIYLKVQEFE